MRRVMPFALLACAAVGVGEIHVSLHLAQVAQTIKFADPRVHCFAAGTDPGR